MLGRVGRREGPLGAVNALRAHAEGVGLAAVEHAVFGPAGANDGNRSVVVYGRGCAKAVVRSGVARRDRGRHEPACRCSVEADAEALARAWQARSERLEGRAGHGGGPVAARPHGRGKGIVGDGPRLLLERAGRDGRRALAGDRHARGAEDGCGAQERDDARANDGGARSRVVRLRGTHGDGNLARALADLHIVAESGAGRVRGGARRDHLLPDKGLAEVAVMPRERVDGPARDAVCRGARGANNEAQAVARECQAHAKGVAVIAVRRADYLATHGKPCVSSGPRHVTGGACTSKDKHSAYVRLAVDVIRGRADSGSSRVDGERHHAAEARVADWRRRLELHALRPRRKASVGHGLKNKGRAGIGDCADVLARRTDKHCPSVARNGCAAIEAAKVVVGGANGRHELCGLHPWQRSINHDAQGCGGAQRGGNGEGQAARKDGCDPRAHGDASTKQSRADDKLRRGWRGGSER